MSLAKVLRLSGSTSPLPEEDLAADLVRAARAGAEELRAWLASDDDDDDGDDDSKGGKDDDAKDDHSGHAVFKALKKRGRSDAQASAMCARADKRVKATALAESVVVALDGLAAGDGDWVESSALDTWTSTGKPESGSAVPFADPGYLADGRKRYPLDKNHIRLSVAAFAQEKNASRYTSEQAAAMTRKLTAAAAGHGIMLTPPPSDADGEKAVSAMLALAAKAAGDGGIPMNHGPFTGTHVHTHFQSAAHAHPHQHVGDNSHDGGPLHRPGSKPQRNW